MNIYEQRIIDSCALYPHHNGMMISVVEDHHYNWRKSFVQLHTLNHGVLTKQCRSKYYNKLKNKGVMTFSHLAILRQFINENKQYGVGDGLLSINIQNCVDGRYISKFEREKQELEHFFTFEAGQYKTFSKCTTVPDVMVFSKLLNIFKKRVFGDYIGGISSPSSEEGSPSNFSAKF